MSWNWKIDVAPLVTPIALLAIAALTIWMIALTKKSIEKAESEGLNYWKTELPKLIERRVLISLLVIELFIFSVSGMGYGGNADETYDYYAFALPCAAGIVVGFGLLIPDPTGASPLRNAAVKWLFVSAGLLLAAWVFYVLRHPSVWVWSAALIATGLSLITLIGVELLGKPRAIWTQETWALLAAVFIGCFVVLGLLSAFGIKH